MPGKSIQVLSPKTHATAKTMQQNQGSFIFNAVTAKGQSPQLVAVRDGDKVFGKSTADT